MPSKLSWNEDLVEVFGSDNSFEPADAYSTEESMDLDNEGLEADGVRYVRATRLKLWRIVCSQYTDSPGMCEFQRLVTKTLGKALLPKTLLSFLARKAWMTV
jgi:hypothetical protein